MHEINFRSAKFLPFLPESAQSNPGVYGYELAHWLSQALAARGLVTSYPIGEDWGWLIEFIDGDDEYMIGCASVAEDGEGYRGRPLDWRVFVQRRKTPVSLLRKPKSADRSDELGAAITASLRDGGVEV
jgi:hypothetical protein